MGLNVPESRTHFILWCMVKSPLLLGCDVTKMEPEYMAIVNNTELIAINQDKLGVQVTLLMCTLHLMSTTRQFWLLHTQVVLVFNLRHRHRSSRCPHLYQLRLICL